MSRKFKFECNCYSGPKKYSWALMLMQHSHIAWALSQHWCPMLGTNIETTFKQCCLNVVSVSVSNVWHQCLDNIHPTLPICCLNLSPQHWVATLAKLSHNIAWTLSRPHSPTLGVMLSQYSHHVVWILSQSRSLMLGSITAETFTQLCDNVVATFGFSSKCNIGTIFTHFLDVHTTFLGWLKISTNQHHQNIGDQHWDNVGTNVMTMLPQHRRISWVVCQIYQLNVLILLSIMDVGKTLLDCVRLNVHQAQRIIKDDFVIHIG